MAENIESQHPPIIEVTCPLAIYGVIGDMHGVLCGDPDRGGLTDDDVRRWFTLYSAELLEQMAARIRGCLECPKEA